MDLRGLLLREGEGLQNGGKREGDGGKDSGREEGDEKGRKGGRRREGVPIEMKTPNQNPKYTTARNSGICQSS